MTQQKGWVFLLIGLLISSFLGGAISVFFSPDRMREFVDRTLQEKQPKFEVKFSSVQLQLAVHGWPAVAIQINDLVLSPKDTCVTNSHIQVDHLVVPLRFWPLLKKKVRFGHVEAGALRFHYRSPTCSVAAAAAPSALPAASEILPETESEAEMDFARLERFFQKRWAREVVNTTRFLDQFTVLKLEITRDDQSLPPIIFEDLEMRFDSEKKEAHVTSFVQLQSPLVGKARFGRLEVAAVVRAAEFQLQAQGNLKEGQIDGVFNWAIDRGEVKADLSLRDAPLQELVLIAQNYGWFERLNPNLKNQWLNCDLTTEVATRDLLHAPLQLHQCHLYGDLGDIHVVTQQVVMQKKPDIKLTMQEARVEKWLNAFGWDKSWGRISEFGQFRGEMALTSPNDIEIAGDVSEMEIYLANFEHRVRQKIQNFQLSLAIQSDRFSGQAKDFRLTDGEVEGFFTFNVSLVGDGLLQLAFSQISLSVDSQKALWNGRVPEMALVGRAQLEAGTWTQFTGELALREWVTLPWELTGVKAELERSVDGGWKVHGTADKFETRPESYWLPSFNTALAVHNLSPKDMQWRNIVGDISFAPDGGMDWSNLKSDWKAAGLLLESQGSWLRQKNLSGQLLLKSKSQVSAWDVSGDASRPQISPAGN